MGFMFTGLGLVKEVYPTDLKGKTIVDAYFVKKNILILELSDGTKKKIVGEGTELYIKKRNMNEVRILVQSKDDPKNLLDTEAKAANFPKGFTIIIIEGATAGGQMGVEFIFKGMDIHGGETIIGASVTENNFDAIMGAFVGARMRFNRMPQDQFLIVRQYMKDKAKQFLAFLSPSKRSMVEADVKKFFGL